MLTPVEVKALDNYRLWVKYSDGVEGVVDLSNLVGDGVFALGEVDLPARLVYAPCASELARPDC